MVTLSDSEGNVLLSETVTCSFSSIIISCPELTVGGTYTLSFGDMQETITIEEPSASYGDAESSMFGGTMNFGGMSPRGEQNSDGEMPSGERPDMSAMGGMPQMNENGEQGQRPERPDGMNHGKPFEQTESDTETAVGQEPQQDGQMMGPQESDSSLTPPEQMEEGAPQQPDNLTAEDTAAEETAAETATVKETAAWTWIGISLGVLILGLIVVNVLKGKGIFS